MERKKKKKKKRKRERKGERIDNLIIKLKPGIIEQSELPGLLMANGSVYFHVWGYRYS